MFEGISFFKILFCVSNIIFVVSSGSKDQILYLLMCSVKMTAIIFYWKDRS